MSNTIYLCTKKMKTARLLVCVLTALCAACNGIGATLQGAGEGVNGDTAVLVWSAFECSQYAMMAGKPEQETERLFDLGYENGKRFVQAVNNKKVSEDELRSSVPTGVLFVMYGPTADFMLGRIFEYATREASNLVVKGDKFGLAPVDKWRDAELQKIHAGNEYSTRNCALLK